MYGENKYGELMYGENKRTGIPIDDKYKVDLMQYLTSNYHHRDLVQKLMNVLDLEIGELMYYSISLGEQVSVDNATWGLFRWEDDLGIAYNPSLSIEERREIIKARLRMQGKTTLEMIKNVAEAFSGGEVKIIEYPEEFRFVIKFIGVTGIPANMNLFIETMEQIRPAHLAYSFDYTYNTWGQISHRTWEEMSQFTWEQAMSDSNVRG